MPFMRTSEITTAEWSEEWNRVLGKGVARFNYVFISTTRDDGAETGSE